MTIKLKQLMNERHLSANALADACGVPQPTISRFLAGQPGANITTLKKIAGYSKRTPVIEKISSIH